MLDADTVTSAQSSVIPPVGSTVEAFAGKSNAGTAGVVVDGATLLKIFPKFWPVTEAPEDMVTSWPKSPAPQANPDSGEVCIHGGVEEAGVSQTW